MSVTETSRRKKYC